MYSKEYMPKFKKKVNKVKDKKGRQNIWNKINEVVTTVEINPDHYKNLHNPLQEYKRVHVNGSYVILFVVDEVNKKVTFYNYAHHDDIYKLK